MDTGIRRSPSTAPTAGPDRPLQPVLPQLRLLALAGGAPRVASAAFKAWRDASPERALAHQYDLTLPERPPYVPAVPLMDYEKRARELGIHLFPNSNYPILICIGLFFLALAAPPPGTWVRIVCGAIGLLFFLIRVVGWVVIKTPRCTESVGGVHVQPETEDHH